MQKEAWMARVRVRPMPGKDPFGGAEVALVNALAYVDSPDQFKSLLAKELKTLGVVAQAIEWMEPLESRITSMEPEAELFNVIEDLIEHGGVRFDEFEVE